MTLIISYFIPWFRPLKDIQKMVSTIFPIKEPSSNSQTKLTSRQKLVLMFEEIRELDCLVC